MQYKMPWRHNNAIQGCMAVLHACIHERLVRSQLKQKMVRSATGSTEYGKPTLDLQVALSTWSVNGRFSTFAGRITFAMTRSLRAQACAQWWRASGDDVKPSLGTWRECHPAFQLTKHWDYRSRHQSVDDLTSIGSAALVVLATAGSTNSVRTINAHAPADLWRAAIRRGHTGATLRSLTTTRWRRRHSIRPTSAEWSGPLITSAFNRLDQHAKSPGNRTGRVFPSVAVVIVNLQYT